MIARRLVPEQDAIGSILGRASPLVKLGVATAWLFGLMFVVDARVPLILAGLAILAGPLLGNVPLRRMVLGMAPLWAAALGITVFNTLFAAANNDLALPAIAQIGPWRITEAGLTAGIAVGSRVFAIVAVGILFGQTTDATRLADSLVQQGRLSPRFAYGALAAYQAAPRFADDIATLRQARRIRGLRAGWHPRILVGLLVQAIRHGDRLALAMDARAFGSGPRTAYRVVTWGWPDLAVVALGLVSLAAALGVWRL